MKKLFIATMMVVTLTATAFAAPKTVSSRISNRFQSEFENASNVSWTVTDKYSKASFILEGKTIEAFYDATGEKIGTSQAISVSSLPKKAQKVIDTKYAGYKVTEAISFDKTDEGVQHYVSLENEKSKLVLEVSKDGDVSVFSKKAK
jgi:hypothetical protein